MGKCSWSVWIKAIQDKRGCKLLLYQYQKTSISDTFKDHHQGLPSYLTLFWLSSEIIWVLRRPTKVRNKQNLSLPLLEPRGRKKDRLIQFTWPGKGHDKRYVIEVHARQEDIISGRKPWRWNQSRGSGASSVGTMQRRLGGRGQERDLSISNIKMSCFKRKNKRT